MKYSTIKQAAFFFLLFPVLVFTQTKYWEDLSERERAEILINPDINTYVIDYYKGNLIPNDDSVTYLFWVH